MPDGTPGQVPGQPQQPQAPFGSTPAVAPTANRGHEAAGLQKLGAALQSLTDALPLVGASSEPGQAILDMIKKLAKFVPAGTMTIPRAALTMMSMGSACHSSHSLMR